MCGVNVGMISAQIGMTSVSLDLERIVGWCCTGLGAVTDKIAKNGRRRRGDGQVVTVAWSGVGRSMGPTRSAGAPRISQVQVQELCCADLDNCNCGRRTFDA